jgi:hypothetical protein
MSRAIVIGGSPSSGSSLLLDILGRHSSVASFSETHLLAKPTLWNDWDNNNKYLNRGNLKSPDWFMHTGIDTIKKHQLKLVHLEKVNSVLEYCNQLFKKLALEKGKTIWCEKTPANVYFFHLFGESNIAQRVLTLRNPYDSIASLIFRNVHIIDAVCRTLTNLGIGYLQMHSKDIITIKYESLVHTPKSTVNTLLKNVNIPPDTSIFQNRIGQIKMDGWKHYEDGVITSNSIGRFEELTKTQQAQVMYLTNKLFINNEHLKLYKINIAPNEVISIPFLAKQFDYKVPIINELPINTKRYFLIDKYKRKLRGYPSHQPYPISL